MYILYGNPQQKSKKVEKNEFLPLLLVGVYNNLLYPFGDCYGFASSDKPFIGVVEYIWWKSSIYWEVQPPTKFTTSG